MGAERLTARAAVALARSPGRRGVPRKTRPRRPDPSPGDAATVEWVNDGDTLTLEGGAKVRLVQIDAPELRTDCYGRAALHELIGLTPKGTRVTLVADPALDERDRHGRLLRYVFVGGANVNVELVRRGAASPYYFRNDRGRLRGRARRRRRGCARARRRLLGRVSRRGPQHGARLDHRPGVSR